MTVQQRHASGHLDVIKIGGNEDVDLAATCADVARLVRAGHRILIVHGGSAEATRLGEELGHPPRFVTSPSGHTSRLTDARTLDIFLMATALVNRRIVSALNAAGVSAVGLSGVDGALLRARRKQAIRIVEDGRVRIVRDDRTGRPESVNTQLLLQLLDAGHTPVIAPVGSDADSQPLNVDGDRAAALIAASLNARSLVLLTGAPGLLQDFPDESSLIPHLPAADIERGLEWAQGRMRKKVLGAQEALEGGVPTVIIAAAYGTEPVAASLAGGGTHIGAPLAVMDVQEVKE